MSYLGIAPAEECGELGYLVSGCEPIRMEDMFGFGEYTRISETLTTGYLTDVPSELLPWISGGKCLQLWLLRVILELGMEN